MPKKATSARSGVQRAKPKTQKSFELVRPVTQVQEHDIEETSHTSEISEISNTSGTDETVDEQQAVESSSPVAEMPRYEPVARTATPSRSVKSTSAAKEAATVAPEVDKTPVAPTVPSASKGSAAARLTSRKNAQRTQRNQATLITAEHYSYVRRDLVFIAILAAIMFAVIIILYFIPAIGGA